MFILRFHFINPFKMCAGLIIACLLTSVAGTAPFFADWQEKHGKHYATAEEQAFRELVFIKNLMHIENRNRDPQRHVILAANEFADLLNDEFQARYVGGYRAFGPVNDDNTGSDDIPVLAYTPYNSPLPASIDWVAKGAVTGVKNQGQCGSCWAFSTTGSVEGAWYLATGELVSLSEQQLVDCSVPEGNQGCNGGMMDNAFEYIVKNGGICSEAAYPYTSGSGFSNGTCAATSCAPVAHLKGYVDVTPNNETALLEAVAQQPVSVAVEADGLDWQFYGGGVVTDACGTNLDHGVLVVGYGVDPVAGDFWKVKNSWGAAWGEEGYIRLGRGAKYAPHGECGILMDPSFPVAY